MRLNTTTASNIQLEAAINNPDFSEELRKNCQDELDRRKAEAQTNY